MSLHQPDRPLSPHLQVYRLPLTALTSISHRLTGVALFAGSLLLVAWLWALAYDAAYFDFWNEVASHWAAKLVLMGWTFALFYHLCNGVRHLFWDMGKGFNKHTATKNSMLVIFTALVINAALWCSILMNVSFVIG